MSIPRTALSCLALIAVASCRTHRPLEELVGPLPHAWPTTQALIGASLLDRADFVLEDVSDSDPGLVAEVRYETMPTFGVAGMQPLTQGELHLGLEGALLFGVWAEDADDGPGGSVDVKTALWMTDLSIGPYVSTSMRRDVRAYAGIGAAMLLGFLEVESDATDDDPDGTGFGIGGYARAGVELKLGDGSFLGFGVRVLRADLDFSGSPLDADFDGVQVFLTYTTGSAPYFTPPAW